MSALVVQTLARITANGTSGTQMQSGTFTAPANSLLVVCIEHDGNNSTVGGTITVTPGLFTGGTLVWTLVAARLVTDTTEGGAAYIFTAPMGARISRSLLIPSTWSLSPGTGLRRSAQAYVVVGADNDIAQATAANSGGDLNNQISTTAITPDRDGLLFVADTDYSASGVFTASSNLTSPDGGTDYAGEISVYDGYRRAYRGVSVSGDLNAFGAAAVQHKWVQALIRNAQGSRRHIVPTQRMA